MAHYRSALTVQAFKLTANLFFFPMLKTEGWPADLASISSLNTFWVVVIFARYFSAECGFWKRPIAPLRPTSLLMTLQTAQSMYFSAHFLHESFLCTSVQSGTRQPITHTYIYIYIYIYIYTHTHTHKHIYIYICAMCNNLSVISRKHVFLSEMNISSVSGRNSPWYAEFPN